MYVGSTHNLMGILVTSKMFPMYLPHTTSNLYIVNLSFQRESNLAKGRFAVDLLINRKSVENSGHMSMLISGQIDETIRFLEQTLMRMRA